MAQFKDRLAKTEAGIVRCQEAIAAPDRTGQQVDEQKAGAQKRVLTWITGGGLPDSRPKLDVSEIVQTEVDLTAQRHQREIAEGALAAAETEASMLRRQIAALEGRHQHFINAALIEAAETLGQEYMDQIAATEDKVRRLLGLAVVVGGQQEFYPHFGSGIECDITTPRFGLRAVPGPKYASMAPHVRLAPHIAVTARQAEEASKPWRELAKTWERDPRAEPKKV
jgi:hypothetical protein